ncbi:MAG TPA: hypothetical protein VF614_17520 [Chthoniobacteraceae bacterium]|jgi:antitoxin (DNA-binding transcriptional repressor) of toxin-antitoxin stability system
MDRAREAVTITRNGAAYATLAPVPAAKALKANWQAKLQKRKPLGRVSSVEETAHFWSKLRD